LTTFLPGGQLFCAWALRQGEQRARSGARFPRCCNYLYSLFNELHGRSAWNARWIKRDDSHVSRVPLLAPSASRRAEP